MKTIAHLSGGFDSAASTLLELQLGWEVMGLFINYGQVYATREFEAARKIANVLEKDFPTLWCGLLCCKVDLSNRSSTDVDFYVPMRNLVLVSIAVNFAVSERVDAVTVGNHTVRMRDDDPFCFADASIAFITLMQAVVNECTEKGDNIELRMPLIHNYGSMSKKEIIKFLLSCGFDIGCFWNCLYGGSERCGDCLHCKQLTCILRELNS